MSRPACRAQRSQTTPPGSYRVKLDLEVNGSYVPDPGRARVIFKVDGKEFLNQEFGYLRREGLHLRVHAQVAAVRPRVVASSLQPTVPAEQERNHHRSVRQQGDDRRSARKEPVGEDGELRALLPAPGARRARKRAPRLRHRVADRLRRRRPIAGRSRDERHRRASRRAGRKLPTRSRARPSNRAWRTPWPRCWHRRASCSAWKRPRRTR